MQSPIHEGYPNICVWAPLVPRVTGYQNRALLCGLCPAPLWCDPLLHAASLSDSLLPHHQCITPQLTSLSPLTGTDPSPHSPGPPDSGQHGPDLSPVCCCYGGLPVPTCLLRQHDGHAQYTHPALGLPHCLLPAEHGHLELSS